MKKVGWWEAKCSEYAAEESWTFGLNFVFGGQHYDEKFDNVGTATIWPTFGSYVWKVCMRSMHITCRQHHMVAGLCDRTLKGTSGVSLTCVTLYKISPAQRNMMDWHQRTFTLLKREGKLMSNWVTTSFSEILSDHLQGKSAQGNSTLLFLRWHYSPICTFVSLTDFSQSALVFYLSSFTSTI